ncbi:MAG: amidohydrolase family protein, partial [Cyclobacteriaceae bacterium]
AELDVPHDGMQFLLKHPDSYQAYLGSRPKEWEDRAIDMLIELTKEFRHHIHVVHISSAQSIASISEAQKKGYQITTETCPHYLCFNAENIPDQATVFKCAPPIREKENNEQLWQAIQEQIIDFIVTDHSPSPPAMKSLESGSFEEAWGGIAGLQFSLPSIWSEASKRGMSVEDIARLMSLNVAKFLKLDHKKGKLNPGYDADLVVWDPEECFEVEEENIYHRHKLTPFMGLTLNGMVKQTYVNGNKVYDQGIFSSPKGSIVLKSRNE